MKTVYTLTMATFSFRRFSNRQVYTVEQTKSYFEIKRHIAQLTSVTWDRIDLVRGPFIVENKEDMTSQSEMGLIIHPVERPIPGHLRSVLPDVFEGDMADGPRVTMCCGHAVTPENLFRFCLTTLKGGIAIFSCQICRNIWTLEEITIKAVLSDDERMFFKQRINEITTTGWHFIDKGATNDLLRNCGRITMGYDNIANVPNIRACPKCFLFIEHREGCKTMTCSCGHVFCFSCLKGAVGGSLPCGSYSSGCSVAPVQEIL
ncbi:uncharacterized protein LOC132561473 [Ylistrum balloti]|uniref:uncharacterized protein LOC132561473 n=1 Tax=Ylistrum balloti TaxID=509963 RepID=UPI002905DC80|nr:uncharacterized protein LOC132561473 [Ylistrum balloti]